MKVRVTTASKVSERAFGVAAAIYVLTQEDIQRSGALTVADALREVPGVQVATTGAGNQAITIRGFNGMSADKLLVLVDGRSIYSPDVSGVYWEIEDMILENIDRIEVIRGPGGSLWGTNAVNGVINIITKNAKDTVGSQLVSEAGSYYRNQNIFQYGVPLGADGAIRVFGKYGIVRQSEQIDGSGDGDGQKLAQYGFRADFDDKQGSRLMLQGGYSRTGLSESTTGGVSLQPPYTYNFYGTDMTTVAHAMGRWEKDGKDGAQTQIQAYYDLVDYPYSNYTNSDNTWDFDFQHRFATVENQSITVGAGYRRIINDSWPGEVFNFYPPTHIDQIASAFAQDAIQLGPHKQLSLGLKVENNNYVGTELQPNARLAYTPDPEHTMWGSISRAVRTPNLSDAYGDYLVSVTGPTSNNPLPVTTEQLPAQQLGVESVIANELGYRLLPSQNLALDFATFYNIYQNVLYYQDGAPFTSDSFGVLHTVDPQYTVFGDHGQTYGLETSARYNPTSQLHTTLSYTWLQQSHFVEGNTLGSPHHQVNLHVSWDAARDLKLDTMLYWTDAIFDQQVSAYTKCDTNLTWKMQKDLSLTFGGRDLFVPRHLEYGYGSYIPRSVYAKLSYRF